MAINDWWSTRPNERFWIEVTDREVLGENLHTPKLSTSGKQTPSYTLVSYVKPGDIVFHWWKQENQESAFVGSSTVIGDPVDSMIEWQPRGSYGKTYEGPLEREAWIVPLGEYEDLDATLSLSECREQEGKLLEIRDALAAEFGTIYFPFAFSDVQPLRTAQGYLFKLPAAVVDFFPQLSGRTPSTPATSSPEVEEGKASTAKPSRGSRHDADWNKAVEMRAMEWSISYFEELGYEVLDVSRTESVDLLIAKDDETISVEIKGKSSDATTVNVSRNEVENARTNAAILVVLDMIEVERNEMGEYVAQGGRPRIWRNWVPEEERLLVIDYRYTLPPDGWLS